MIYKLLWAAKNIFWSILHNAVIIFHYFVIILYISLRDESFNEVMLFGNGN